MKNLEQITNKLESANGLDTLLADRVGADDYYTEDYNNLVGDGIDFDLIFDFEADEFQACNSNEGRNFENTYNCVLIGSCCDVTSEEDLILVIENYLEN